MAKERKIPDGPPVAFNSRQDILAWIENNYLFYGDLYCDNIFGKSMYVASKQELLMMPELRTRGMI